mgnify:CR=1 FL=1|jgi:hypothetical protein
MKKCNELFKSRESRRPVKHIFQVAKSTGQDSEATA